MRQGAEPRQAGPANESQELSAMPTAVGGWSFQWLSGSVLSAWDVPRRSGPWMCGAATRVKRLDTYRNGVANSPSTFSDGDLPPSPAIVDASTSPRTRAGASSASCWATAPPQEYPKTSTHGSSRASSVR